MNLPPTFQAGMPLTAGTLTKLATVAREGGNLSVPLGMESITLPGGTAAWIAPAAEVAPSCTRMQLTTAATAGLWALVELQGALEGRYWQTILQCRQAAWSDPAHVAILKWGCAENDIVWGQTEGFAPVLYDTTTIPAGVTLGDGHRLGAKKDSYIAQWDMGGPLFVRMAQGVEGAYGVAVVEITRKRFDNKMVDTGGQCDGAYERIIWDPTVFNTDATAGKVGDTTVSLV